MNKLLNYKIKLIEFENTFREIQKTRIVLMVSDVLGLTPQQEKYFVEILLKKKLENEK